MAIAVSWLLASLVASSADEDFRRPTVGITGQIEELVIPGPELEAKPIEDDTVPMVLRVTAVYPHGDAHRYSFSYYGLEPGTFDLRDFLQRKDRSSMDGVPPIEVEVLPVRPPGQVLPNAPGAVALPALGGYKTLLVVAGAVWVVVLGFLLFGWRSKGGGADGVGDGAPATLADRLRPLVEKARGGGLNQDEEAELERLLLGFWRARLSLQEVSAVEAIGRLREHPEAGQLLRELEEWLHRPGGPPPDGDVAALLEPYENIESAT